MGMTFQELQMYTNFEELSRDVLDLAKEILPEQLLYLSSINGTQQIILKLSSEESKIPMSEGMMLNLNHSLCNFVDFEKNQPAIFEDVREERRLEELRDALEKAHIRSYLGIPISLGNGEQFGTLCAIHDEESHFDEKSIALLQRIVRMFSYYLNLERFAYRDSLTDLYNRRYLSQFFEDQAKTEGVIFFLDLDGFKKVNDVHGHDAGDLVLKEVALKLQRFVAEHTDAFAVRLGGDEFVVHFSSIASNEEMRERAEQLLASLSTWDTGYALSTSIGIVTYTEDENVDLKSLLKDADHALYSAKKAGKNTYRFL